MADSFQPRFVDLVRNYTSTIGTGNFEPGVAVMGYRSFGSAIQAGESFYYSAMGIDKPGEFEIGRGTMQADGTISRDPISGTLTNFTAGSKTLALVAAGEWYQEIDSAVAASAISVATRGSLAALADRSKPALLLEPGREGIFVFDATDRSARITIDPSQGVSIAPETDPTGASGAWLRKYSSPVEARWFGAVGDGVADDTAAIQAALQFLQDGGGNSIRLGEGTFVVTYVLFCGAPGLLFDARQATIVASLPDNFPTFNYWGAGTKVRGGTWKIVSGNVGTRHFDIVAPDCELDGVEMIKDPEAGNYQAYIREDADRFTMRNCRTQGSNGFFQTGSDALYLNNHFVGRKIGGDDAIGIYGSVDSVRGIKIVGNYFENLAYFCSIGSTIGTDGVDDPTYSRGVYDVIVSGNSGKACSGILFIKPGAISAYDFRDGTVEGVVVSNNVLRDENGDKFTRGIAITAARGARVRNVTGKNNVIIARTLDDGGRHVGGLDIFIPDYSSLSTAGGPAISDIDIEVSFRDPHDGAAAGTAGIPGLPTNNIVAIERQSPTYGTISNITVDVTGNGCLLSGINIQNGVDDSINIRRAILTNVDTNGSSSFAGIQHDCRIRIGDDTSIKMAPGAVAKQYLPYNGGAILAHVDHVALKDVAAGTDSNRAVRWAAPRNCFVHKVEIINVTNISRSGDDTNYIQHEVRNEDAGGFVQSVSNQLTGGIDLPGSVFNTIYDAAKLTGAALSDCFYTRGGRMSYTKNDFGAGKALTDAYLRVHWAPF
jgi:hypothetical protein